MAQQLDELVQDTSALSNVLKRRIKSLERQGGAGRDGQIRKQQVRYLCAIGDVQIIDTPCVCRPVS